LAAEGASQALPPAPKLLCVSGPWGGGKQRQELPGGQDGGSEVEWRDVEAEGCLDDREAEEGPRGRRPARSTATPPSSFDSWDDEHDSHTQMRPEFETLLLRLKGGV
jgi:hypothetical protein